jgi:hypothetical protein
LAAVRVATAQAPQISPAGDPSIQADTIYTLAVKTSDHPDEGSVFLLDDGVIRVEADGRGSRTYRQIVQILTREGAEAWGEQAYSYVSSRERFTLNWARVVRPDGTIISPAPTHEQESSAPAATVDPVYSDVKIHRITLAGVEAGAIVDFSYTVETLQPIMPGDFHYSWFVTNSRLTRRSRYIVDAPASLGLRIKERNLTFPRRTTDAQGRRVYLWATTEVPKVELEPFAADSNGIVQSITISAPLKWDDVARWYAGLVRDRYALTTGLDSAIALIEAGATTADDSLRRLHRWVAQDFRYVSLSLGIGGFQPRRPADVLQSKFGDCKDKATLFIAAAARLGVRAYPVLLNAGGRVDRGLPSAGAFDHMIAAVERPKAPYLYLDLTAEFVPFGALPMADQGEFGLVVHPDGHKEEVTLPEDSVGVNVEHISIVGELSPEGAFHARLNDTSRGTYQYPLRRMFSKPLTGTQRNRFTEAFANALYPGATGDSLEMFDGRDLEAAPHIGVVLRHDHAASASGDREIFTLPISDLTATAVIAALEGRGPRRFPIDVGAVVGPRELIQELDLTLPEGWQAELPPAVSATSAFGTYQAEYAQNGRVLHVMRRLRGNTGILPPDRIGDLIAWLKARSKDDVRFIVLRRS